MKQTVKDRAEAYRKEMFAIDGDQVRFDSIDMGSARYVAFKAGAEWQASQSPWISIEDEFPPYGKEILFLNDKNEIIGCQIFDKRHDIKIYCDWHCISYWALANFPEHLSKNK